VSGAVRAAPRGTHRFDVLAAPRPGRLAALLARNAATHSEGLRRDGARCVRCVRGGCGAQCGAQGESVNTALPPPLRVRVFIAARTHFSARELRNFRSSACRETTKKISCLCLVFGGGSYGMPREAAAKAWSTLRVGQEAAPAGRLPGCPHPTPTDRPFLTFQRPRIRRGHAHATCANGAAGRPRSARGSTGPGTRGGDGQAPGAQGLVWRPRLGPSQEPAGCAPGRKASQDKLDRARSNSAPPPQTNQLWALSVCTPAARGAERRCDAQKGAQTHAGCPPSGSGARAPRGRRSRCNPRLCGGGASTCQACAGTRAGECHPRTLATASCWEGESAKLNTRGWLFQRRRRARRGARPRAPAPLAAAVGGRAPLRLRRRALTPSAPAAAWAWWPRPPGTPAPGS
jgi:hypothetical protein